MSLAMPGCGPRPDQPPGDNAVHPSSARARGCVAHDNRSACATAHHPSRPGFAPAARAAELSGAFANCRPAEADPPPVGNTCWWLRMVAWRVRREDEAGEQGAWSAWSVEQT